MAAPAAKAAASAGWVVQLSSQRDETTAWSSWKKLQASTGGLLANHAPAVVRADLGAKGIVYRVQVGPFPSQDDANQLCAVLKVAGGQCIVQKN